MKNSKILLKKLKELPVLAHRGLASYDIKLNEKYKNIVRAMNGLEKEEAMKESNSNNNNNNNSNTNSNGDEEKKGLVRPSIFFKQT